MTNGTVLAVGIDGACWPLVDDWIDQGILPNLKKIRDGGTWGDLESCVPPVTCPAWKCYSTSQNPGELGVFWWESLDIEAKESYTPTSKSFTQPELWDILNEAGVTTGVVGMPLTYPPKEVDGFMVSGGPGAPDVNFTYPESIEDELKEEFDYTPRPTYPADAESDNDEVFAERSVEQVDLDFKVAKYLYKKYDVDFLQVCSFEINAPLQHQFYDGEPTKRAWKIIDGHLGDLAEEFEYVVIHSDHGTSEMDRQFFINSWLAREGYLTRDRSFFEKLADYGVTRDRILRVLDALRLRKPLSNIEAIRNVGKRIPDSRGLFGEKEGAAIFDKVLWEETDAVGLAQGPLYLNTDKLTDEEYDATRDKLIREIESVVDDDNDANPVQQVFRKENVYHGEYIDKAPDLVALDAPEYHKKGGIGKKELFRKSEWRGNNARQGLHVIFGPEIDSNRTDAEIYDIVPTILGLFDVESPSDLNGNSVINK